MTTMKMAWRCLTALLLASCVSPAALRRWPAGTGGVRTPPSHRQDLPGPSLPEVLPEVLLDDLLRWREEVAAEATMTAAEATEEEGEPESDGVEEARQRRSRAGARDRKAGCKNFFWKTFTSC
ncbi:somatostatin-1-like [Stigmatopora nigra]